MRVIDADALLERMRKDPLFPLVERYGVSGVIDAEPTVEPKTGRWIPCKELAREMLADKTVNILYDHYECSLCRCTLPNLLYNQDGEPFYKFCPNCGASMARGEEDE